MSFNVDDLEDALQKIAEKVLELTTKFRRATGFVCRINHFVDSDGNEQCDASLEITGKVISISKGEYDS